MTGIKPSTLALVQAALVAGFTEQEMSAKFDISLPTARKYASLIREGGVHPEDLQHARDDEHVADMARRYRGGETLKAIGDSYGLTRERVRQLLSRDYGFTGADGGQAIAARAKRVERAAARDERCLQLNGCTWAQLRKLRMIGTRMMAKGLDRSRTPCGAFNSQRQNAKTRGIKWELSLWQWWSIWQESGHWEKRGRGHGYGMARFGDVGPYAVGNVEIITCALNSHLGKKSDLPIGVSFDKKQRRYRAQRQEKGKLQRLGTFPTPELAHAAYLAAGGA